jgi:HPt (histidine-containing phosphotransfer) domain-containing protein
VLDQSQQAQAEEELPLVDARIMHEWCADLAEADVRDLLARVPAECQNCLTGIRSAIAAADLPAAKRMAHRLKGMAGNLGAVRLAKIARSIELGCADLADAAARTAALEKTVTATLEAIKPGS